MPALLNDVIHKIIRRMNAGAPYVEILDFVFEALSPSIPFDRMSVALLNEDGTRLKSHWVRSTLVPCYIKRDYEAPVSESIRGLLESGKPRLLLDLHEYLNLHPTSVATRLILQDGVRSSLTCPLIVNSKPIGVIFFSSFRPNTYNESHISIFSELAEDLALVIQNGRLQKFFAESKSKDRMLAMVVHDLRSPASVIYGFLQMLNDEEWFQQLDDKTKKIFEILNRNVNSILSLLSDLSDSSQMRNGKMSVSAESVVLGDFLKKYEMNARVLAQRKQIGFKLKLSETLPRQAHFDPLRLQQALENLTTNAIKFSNPGTEIAVEVTAVDSRLVFSVTDQGQGIPADELPLLFRHFGKTSVKPTANESSSGLGLFIAKSLIEAHGGQIQVESAVNAGSTFSFWLPQL